MRPVLPGELDHARRVGDRLAPDLLKQVQTFRDVTIVPQHGSRHDGGPIWPNFHRRIHPRTCWGVLPIPIDRRPQARTTPRSTLPAGMWCGLLCRHYGHLIADFSMRIACSAAFDPTLPLIFALPDRADFEVPRYFWQVLAALGVDRRRVVLVREPLRVETLHVFPQAERPFGKGPSRSHLDLLDDLPGPALQTQPALEAVYVSRSRVKRGGQIAGETYLEEVLRNLGVTIFFPEEHSVAEQIACYRRARRLIFSEGSAIHTLQLVGRVPADVAVLVRRPLRWFGYASLKPRARSLTYLRAVEALVVGLGPSRRSERHRGITILDGAGTVQAFQRIGLDLSPHWDETAFRRRRDRDLAAWIAWRKRGRRPAEEKEFVDLQLASLCVPVRY